MAHHDLKTWPEYFTPVALGLKTFEIRKNDRNFAVGDTLRLYEYDPVTKQSSGRDVWASITYMTDFAQQPGFVVLAIGR